VAEKAVHVVISGRVQGVWFRGWMKREAATRQVTGWVRNRRDGTVEAVFAGAAADLDSLIAACHHGPPAARVIDVQVTPTANPGLGDFRHLPTT